MMPSLRQFIRRAIDRGFSQPCPGIVSLGSASPWAVIAEAIPHGSLVISGGAGTDISFEVALCEQTGAKVLLFDPSPTGIATVGLHPHPRLHFFAERLAGKPGTIAFTPPIDPSEGSYTNATGPDSGDGISFSCRTVSSLLDENPGTEPALLKLDIEGFEYEVIDGLLDSHGAAFPQIAVEFHHFRADIPMSPTIGMIGRLRRAGYRLAHKTQGDFLFVRSDLWQRQRQPR